MTINFILLLCFGLFSCKENTKNTSNKLEIERQFNLGKIDSAFHFKDKIYSIFEDSRGNYWIGSKENGLCKYNGKTYTYFTTIDGLPSNSISSIQEDKFGNIWLESGKDITKFDGKQFIVFDKKYIPTIDIKENPIQLSKNDIWFKDQSKLGIFRYDGNQFTFISFEDPSLNLTQKYSHFFVSSITEVANNKIWFGTIMQGGIGFNGEKFDRIVNELFNFESNEEFLHIRSMLLDSKGNLWIGNNGIGVILKKGDSYVHFSKEQGKLIPMNEFEDNTKKNQFANNTGLQSVFAIEEDNEGNIWFGDRDSGAWKYDGKNLSNYRGIYQKEGIKELIWNIYSDQSGNLFFILVSGTVLTFNGQSFDKFEGFKK